MSKSELPPDYHAGYNNHPPHHGGGYHPQGYHHNAPHHHNAPQPQHMHNTFAPVLNQPQTQATNIVVNAGGAGAATERQWTTRLCGCFEDIGGCLCAIFCTTCMAMSVSSRMNELFCLPFLVPQWLLALRVKLRAANKIKGGVFKDCVMTTCCPACVLCQLKRELDNIERRKPVGTL